MKQIKILFSTFFKGLHIYNKEIYKTPKHLKENTFEFLLFNNNPQNISSRENMIWQIATLFYAKKFMTK